MYVLNFFNLFRTCLTPDYEFKCFSWIILFWQPYFQNLFAWIIFFLLWQTTLLNHILTSQHGKRIAVIENEVLRLSLKLKSLVQLTILILALIHIKEKYRLKSLGNITPPSQIKSGASFQRQVLIYYFIPN